MPFNGWPFLFFYKRFERKPRAFPKIFTMWKLICFLFPYMKRDDWQDSMLLLTEILGLVGGGGGGGALKPLDFCQRFHYDEAILRNSTSPRLRPEAFYYYSGKNHAVSTTNDAMIGNPKSPLHHGSRLLEIKERFIEDKWGMWDSPNFSSSLSLSEMKAFNLQIICWAI